MGSLLDAYELGGVAGEGRTTQVRLAVRRGDARPVALKQLRSEHVERPDRRGSFIRQAQRASLLDHEGIERVIDVIDDREGPVMVTEWVDGRSLQRLAAGLRNEDIDWDPSIVMLIARHLLEALRHAHHRHGLEDDAIVHGGINLRNVMIDIDGKVRLVDFGMASVWQEALEPWQDLEALRYLSADHMRHGPSPGSDLYSVGAIVHELLSGHRFRAECETETEMRATIDRLEPPGPPRAEIPAQLERLRRRLLEPTPNPRLTLEHLLDLCVAVQVGDAREALRTLVRNALRNDSTQPDPKVAADGVAQPRIRPRATAHDAASKKRLKRVPLGQRTRTPADPDTQSVPIRVDHEKTAPRKPLFLDQTAPPRSMAARDAERRRSGSDLSDPDTIADEDTAPISVEIGAPQNVQDFEPAPVPGYDDFIEDPDVTLEVDGAPQLPGEPKPEVDIELDPPPKPPRSSPWRHFDGPLGWALLGALAVAIGLPLVARCSAESEHAPASRSSD